MTSFFSHRFSELGLKKKNQKIGALLIIIVLAAIGVFVAFNPDSLDLRRRASLSTGVATLEFTPSTSTLGAGSTTTLDLMLNTQDRLVDGVQAEAVISGTLPSNITFTPATVPGLQTIVQSIDPVQNTRKFTLLMITSNPLQPYTTNSAPVKLGTLSFTAPTSGQMSITFDPANTFVTQNNTGATDILKTPTNPTYSFATTSKIGRLFFGAMSPTAPQQVNRNFAANIFVDTSNQNISGVDARLSFDPTKLQVVSVQQPNNPSFTQYQELTYNNTAGTISVSGSIGSTASPVNGSNIALATVTFKPLSTTANTSVTFDFTPGNRNDSNIITAIASGEEPEDILASVSALSTEIVAGTGATPSPGVSPSPGASPGVTPSPGVSPSPAVSPTPGVTPSPGTNPSPSPDVSTTLRVRFQGKSRPGLNLSNTMTLSRRLASGSQNQVSTLAINSLGEANTIITPGNYIMLVKVPGYLARRFGSTGSPLQVLSVASTLDFTGTPLLGGDFNNDGEVNEIDYSAYFLPNFRNSNTLVDLDGSGEVNNLDFAIMRSNWGLTADTLP